MSQPKTPEELNAEFVRIAADLGEGIEEAVAAAVAEERAAVVAWLRENIWQTDDRENAAYAHAADYIERGDHRREEER